VPENTRRCPPCTLGKHTSYTIHWSDVTEERRLVEEEGSLTKKTWLQKKEDLEREGELLSGPLLSSGEAVLCPRDYTDSVLT